MEGTSLTRFAWLSIAAAILTIGLKTTAWWITGSVGLLSDAMESVVNLVGGLMALAMLTVAERPADEDHPYGHGKAEYFSSGVEGTLILIAAISIGGAAVNRLISPKPLEEIGVGLGIYHEQAGVRFHALRTRQAGARKFISLHVLVPGDWTVQRGHQLVERIENDIRNVVLDSTIFTHLEPLDDPISWDDEALDRRPHK
jgi:divalent metal cation (Fe/Co/Zn/Cd) transporter